MAEYIERVSLLETIGNVYDCADPNQKRGRDIRRSMIDVRKIIENQPAADVQEVRHGDWIAIDTTSYKNSEEGTVRKYYICSLCSTKNAIRSKYCPNCGAKMDKE